MAANLDIGKYIKGGSVDFENIPEDINSEQTGSEAPFESTMAEANGKLVQEGEADGEVKFKGIEKLCQSSQGQQDPEKEQNSKDPKQKPQKENKKVEGEEDLTPENAKLMLAIRDLLHQHKEEIKGEINKTEARIKNIEDAEVTVSEKLNNISEKQVKTAETQESVQKDILELKEQVNLLTDTVVRQANILKEVRSQKEGDDLRRMKCEVIVRGITEKQKENCTEVINQFFNNILKPENAISVVEAHRKGQGKNRPMIVTLSKPSEKAKIYKCVKNLKGVTNEKNQSHQISDHLPAGIGEQSARQKAIARENRSCTVDQLQMSQQKGELLIKGTKYHKLV